MSRVKIFPIWVHLTLLAMVCIFLFPFAWMLGTSLKTDEELLSDDLFPGFPTFRGESPYVRRPIEVNRPQQVSHDQWERNLPAFRGLASRAIAADVTTQDLQDAAASVLLERSISRLGISAWADSREQADAAFEALLTPEAISLAVDDRLARLELYGLQVRALDAHIYNLVAGAELARTWQIESGEASLEPANADAARLHYAFASPDSNPVVLRYVFNLPVEMEMLHKLALSLRPDDSWHRVDATLDVNGRRWTLQRTTYLAQHRPMSIIFQPPTFEDETNKPKTWVPLRVQDSGFGVQVRENPSPSPGTPGEGRGEGLAEGSGFGGSGKAVLRLIISPSSTLQAVSGKVQRNYWRAFYAMPFWTYVGNSTLIVVLSTLGTFFSSTFVAYAFARLNWPLRSAAFGLLLASMMLPPQVTMVPSFLIWRSLGLYNTLAPIWVPAWFGSAFFIFLMVQHMKTIPRELEESARIDGLGYVQTWWYIILPQVKPAAAAIAILTFLGAWNEFLLPLIYLRDQSKFPLSLGFFALRIDSLGDWTMIMAGNVMMTLPVVVIFFLFQRWFVHGMTMSGMKG